MNYRFIGQGARFYPDIRDAEGKSLMAEDGTVFGFDGAPPSDGLWVPAEDAPEPTPSAQEASEPVPAPDPVPPVPEPVPAPAEQPAPVPVEESEPEPVAPAPEPEPVPEKVPYQSFPSVITAQASATPPVPWTFPGLPTEPYTR